MTSKAYNGAVTYQRPRCPRCSHFTWCRVSRLPYPSMCAWYFDRYVKILTLKGKRLVP